TPPCPAACSSTACACWPAAPGSCATCAAPERPGHATGARPRTARPVTARPVLLAWSGGKDAAWALHVLRQRGDVEVVGLLSTVREDDGRATMQEVAREVLHAQARAARLPLLEVALPDPCANDDYERLMADALAGAAARWPGLRTIAFGDLLLEDIRDWRAARMARIG